MRGKNVLKKWQLPIVVNALRACISNCVRHADAQNLYAYVTQETAETKIVFTNDGKVPTSPITEGGGLSSLRRSIENKGGVMTVHSAPKFILEIRLPHNENNRMKNI